MIAAQINWRLNTESYRAWLVFDQWPAIVIDDAAAAWVIGARNVPCDDYSLHAYTTGVTPAAAFFFYQWWGFWITSVKKLEDKIMLKMEIFLKTRSNTLSALKICADRLFGSGSVESAAGFQRAGSSVMRGTGSLDRTVPDYVTCDLWTAGHVQANIALNQCDYQTYLLRIRQSQCLSCFNQLRRN